MYEKIELIELKISNLLEDYSLQIPECQRILDNIKLQSLIDYQKEIFIKYQCYKFIGVLSICQINNQNYLVDGQHRFCAMEQLYKKYNHDFNIFIQLITVNSIENLKLVFENINKNTPLPDIVFDNNNEKNIISETVNYFQHKYPKVWSSSSKCHRPSIFINYFQESLLFMQNYLRFENSEELINVIEDYNINHSKQNKDDYKDKSISNKMFNNACETNFYLGLYKYDIEQDYGYLWSKNIIEYKCPNVNIIKKKKQNGKAKIKKALRTNVWNTYIGDKIRETKCKICNNYKIDTFNYECGHIIAEANGGSIDLDNLLPICGECNKSMGTEDMDLFVKNIYKNNYKTYEKFKQKKLVNEKSHSLLSNIF